MSIRIITMAMVLTWGTVHALGETAKDSGKPAIPTNQENEHLFQKMLQGAVLQGQFSVQGKGLPLHKERYEIRGVTKQPEDNYWVLMTRVQYDDHDLTVPIPVAVHWAGKTPVITVDNLTIPGLGTFDARVLLHDGLYAGTWRHGDVAGNLWGEIVPAK